MGRLLTWVWVPANQNCLLFQSSVTPIYYCWLFSLVSFFSYFSKLSFNHKISSSPLKLSSQWCKAYNSSIFLDSIIPWPDKVEPDTSRKVLRLANSQLKKRKSRPSSSIRRTNTNRSRSKTSEMKSKWVAEISKLCHGGWKTELSFQIGDLWAKCVTILNENFEF